MRRSWGDQFSGYLTANVLGTQRVLEACAAADVPRLVFASSSSVYGAGNGAPSRETDPLLPLSPYGVSKLAAERLCLAYANRPSAVTSVVALRYFSVYGPRQRPDMAFSRIMRAALSGRAVPLYGSGAQRRDFTHVTDTVAATIAAASVEARAEVINVASGRSVPLSQALRTIAALAGTEVAALRRGTQPGDADTTAADLSKARDRLGYEPQMLAAEGDNPARRIQLVLVGLLADRLGQRRPQRGDQRGDQRAGERPAQRLTRRDHHDGAVADTGQDSILRTVHRQGAGAGPPARPRDRGQADPRVKARAQRLAEPPQAIAPYAD